MPYATVIVGAMPVIVTATLGITLPSNTVGAKPVIVTVPEGVVNPFCITIGATPTKLTFFTSGVTLSNTGRYPVIVNSVAVGTKIVLAITIFNVPLSFHTVPGLKPTGLVGSANNVN